jgi:hypothetical protein
MFKLSGLRRSTARLLLLACVLAASLLVAFFLGTLSGPDRGLSLPRAIVVGQTGASTPLSTMTGTNTTTTTSASGHSAAPAVFLALASKAARQNPGSTPA